MPVIYISLAETLLYLIINAALNEYQDMILYIFSLHYIIQNISQI